ncbi:poly(beta-D-mannuronate) lyase [Maribacter sedimenticola]|uniref:Poly(Beta-D-mannuronate) lyase n=1 Tax=Maribacter sedimenticola TaxID=228956 RepID=A0ABY1SDK2_9FLAO|nr:chondroitinase-B domain-containing protein [Maribacter sedimenticola]SNR27321.1 poly(beta-D-mannuronate) lyase [Maribacter sedimenticola]
MIKKAYLLITLVLLQFSCKENDSTGIYVQNSTELHTAIANAIPGDVIIMANGEWTDVEIKFVGYGNDQQPITLKAETPGEVILTGNSNLRLGGEHLVVDGLFFTKGYSTTSSVITFAINQDTVANHSRISHCAIVDFNKPQRNQTDLWVLFNGRYNELDHCYIAGKSNRGPTVRVDLAGNQSIKNHHKITNNYFGPRPPKGGPSAETIQLGNSFTSMVPSYTLVANNFFDHCNGEVEVISSKSNFNEFRSNVFYKSEGSLVTRHGNYCIIDGNYFIGDVNSEQIGGVRLIGTGHWVTNNYFYNLKGKTFRSPLAVMNGIPKSPLNRYLQVTDVVVAYNTWVNCISPWQFGVGSNIDQKDILPASEIRSERPIRTIVANNLVYNTQGDEQPIIAHDALDGINFKSNLINNQGNSFNHEKAFRQENFALTQQEDYLFVPNSSLPNITPFNGFEFELIAYDLFGNSRASANQIGAIANTENTNPNIMDRSNYGPGWFDLVKINDSSSNVFNVETTVELETALLKAKNGDTIVLTAERYELNSSLKIDKKIWIKGALDRDKKISMHYKGAPNTPLFQMNPKGQLTLSNVLLEGNQKGFAFASLTDHMSSLYNLTVTDCEIINFAYVLKAYKNSFSEFISFRSTLIKNCANGLELSAETDDRGDYNAENIHIENCRFENVSKNVVDYYRGGYDESTVGGNLKIANSTFENCGGNEENGILLNTYGIINVNLTGNTFTNNKVKLVARLWGAKNNLFSNNHIENSGEMVVEQNLPLTLMY